MVGLIRKNLHEFHLKLLHYQFTSGDYRDILKAHKYFYNVNSKYSVYKNIFRILSMKGIGDQTWKKDFELLNQLNLLDVFNSDEKNYILVFMHRFLFDEVGKIRGAEIDLKMVSSKIKKYFPLDRDTQDLWI